MAGADQLIVLVFLTLCTERRCDEVTKGEGCDELLARFGYDQTVAISDGEIGFTKKREEEETAEKDAIAKGLYSVKNEPDMSLMMCSVVNSLTC